MQYDPDDTIAAIGTAPGGAPRGMVRISGPQVLQCLGAFFRSADANDWQIESEAPQVIEGSIRLGGGEPLDLPCDLFLWPGKRSYTRQPTAELHTIGSPPLLDKLLRIVCDGGVRLAQPGEFTLRAFLAGRLDLTQAEAVLGVIDARSSDQLHTALEQLAGGLSQPLARLREQLLHLLAELEAGLDFVEEDIEFITADQLGEQLAAARTIVAEVAAQLESREDASDLPRVVLSGPPNVGKSSLFNALVERFAASHSDHSALVSAQSGTTRDFITAEVDFDGLACQLVDTAGVDSLVDEYSIDQIAQKMTSQQRDQASLILLCQDAGSAGLNNLADLPPDRILVGTKIDLSGAMPTGSAADIYCSSISGEGINKLAQLISERLSSNSAETGHAVANTAARCAESLHHADGALAQAIQIVDAGGGEELVAAEVRGALHAIGQIVGTVYTDDILDRIFGQFCIGK